jgi:two-component system sensor histidine kinase GlrK
LDFLVLNDNDLYQGYTEQHTNLLRIIEQAITSQKDTELVNLLNSLKAHNLIIKNNIADVNNLNGVPLTVEKTLQLSQLQKQFKQLVTIKDQIKQRSNFIINEQAKNIDLSAEKTSDNILSSLFSIPITLLIAIIFILLITRPLKRLINKINTLEQGNFQEEITLDGTAEVIAITEALETMRQRLHTLEMQKSSFIRHISHELKTPLAAIREGTELIYDHSVGSLNDDQQEICKIIKLSVNRLQRLIEDLLDFNIVLDSTSLISAENISLNNLMDKVIEQRKLEIKRKGLSIKFDGSALSLYCNVKQLSVILDNLLSNAIKYAPLASTITIKHTTQTSQLAISIIDEGPGISKEHQAQVCDAFFQGTPPQNSNIKGSGLGLTIVKELLMRLNGEIIIKNNNNKSGTCITITLPNSTLKKSIIESEKC